MNSGHSTEFAYSRFNLYEFEKLLDAYANKTTETEPEASEKREPFLLAMYRCIVLALNESKNVSRSHCDNDDGKTHGNSLAEVQEQMKKQLKNMFVGCILHWMKLERRLPTEYFSQVCLFVFFIYRIYSNMRPGAFIFQPLRKGGAYWREGG